MYGLNNEAWNSFGVSSEFLEQNPNWKIDSNWNITNQLGWTNPNTFSQYDYSSGTKTTTDLIDTSAIFMWHDPSTPADIINGSTGDIDTYYIYSFELSKYGFSFENDRFQMNISIAVDDDFEFFIDGVSFFKNDDFGKPGDLGPDKVFTINDFSLGKSEFSAKDDIINIALHATDGNLNSPKSFYQKRILLDIEISKITEPSSYFLFLMGLMIIIINKARFYSKTKIKRNCKIRIFHFKISKGHQIIVE